MTHLALDLALGTTGICWGPDIVDDWDTLTVPTLTGGARLEWWWQALRVHLLTVDTVIVEGPFLHPKHPSGAVSTIKLHGLLEWMACHEGVTYVDCPPSVLKKWWTGTGNAPKDLMADAAAEHGYPTDTMDSNAVDAVALWHWYAAVQ
jgi:Holliday junction resolvasome RuvABC endonuclease subunit